MNTSASSLLATVTITDTTDRGEGLAQLSEIRDHPVVDAAFAKLRNQTTITVPFTLPGEHVEIEVRHKSRFELVGRAIKVISPSVNRQEAKCEHFETCGGCLLQHLNDNTYSDFKKNIVTNAFQKHGLDTSIVDEPIIIGAGQRRRIDFMARKWDGEVKMGFHEAFSKKPFNVKTCPLIHPNMPQVFKDLRAILTPLLERERIIHVFMTQAQNGLDILLAGFKQPLPGEAIMSLKAFAETHDLVNISYKVKKKEISIHRIDQPTVRFGEHDVPVTAFGFLQATEQSDKIFGNFLTQHVNSSSKMKIADLFCGRGTLSLNLTKLGNDVHGYECDGQALNALKTVDEPLLTVYERNLFDMPLASDQLSNYDAVVMNPPRAGAESQTPLLAKSSVSKCVYISCNADTFARDAKILLDHGFAMKTVVPVDQFMWTPHIEIMAYFER